MKNLKKHLTFSALFVAGTMLSYTAHAEDTSVSITQISNGVDLTNIIVAEGERTGALTTNITATGNLGDLVGTQLTIEGAGHSISGERIIIIIGGERYYKGIKIKQEQKFIVNNVGSVATDGTITESWNSFAHIVTDADAYGGAIYNVGTATITGSSFSNNSAFAYADAYGGAIYNNGMLTITGSSFSNNYVTATAAYADAYGGAIYNNGTLTITGSSFSNNYAAADAASHSANGGAISNQEGDVNIIASTKDSVFSGNKIIANNIEQKNDIHNYRGTINLYAASEKIISFDGGIVGNSSSSSVNINVQGETTYDVAGTVLFKNGSINSGNNFALGAGTLKLESGVTWTNNTLTMNDGTLDIGSSDTGNIGTLEYNGGSLTLNAGANINIDISETEHDQIVFSNNAQFILNGGKITVDLTDNVAVGEVFEIMTNVVWTGTLDPNCVEVLSAPEGWDTNRYFIASMGVTDSTNSLLLTVVPEPSSFGLFAGLAALALAGTRRRRK